MKPIHIPVVAVGAQQPVPPAHAAEMALTVAGFVMPEVPAGADPGALAAAAEALSGFHAALVAHLGGEQAPRLALSGLDPGVRGLLAQALGEGEVSGEAADARLRETAFPGVWRVARQGEEWLEAGPVPAVVEEAAAAAGDALALPEPPPGAMNAPAVLGELCERARAWRAGDAVHAENLSLLPMTPADLAWLRAALPAGAVRLLSRGLGDCRIAATPLRHLWRVQYFGPGGDLVLDLLEVSRVPAAALAPAEDLADSAQRLGELVARVRAAAA